MLSKKAGAEDVSLNEILCRWWLESGAGTEEELRTFRPAVMNRLDRNTTGLIFAAKTYKGAKELSLLFKEKNHPKVYRCICAGEIKEEQLLKHFLSKDEETNRVRITPEAIPGSKEIITGIKPIKSNGKITLLEVKLYTGRTHQIRAHLSYINHPVIGDYKYGNDSINKEYKTKYSISSQMLHSFAMDIPGIGELTAAVPEEFEKVFH